MILRLFNRKTQIPTLSRWNRDPNNDEDSDKSELDLRSGLLTLAVYLLLASTSLAQLNDTTIAFVSFRDWDWPAEKDPNFEIYLMNPDGKQIRRLTEQLKSDFEPAWSPDGKQIAFVSYQDLEQVPKGEIHRGEIYVMNPDGTNPINLTQSPERADFISSWSPDGKQIAFTSDEGFKQEGGGSRRNIWVMDADGGNPRNLTNHGAKDRMPDWSPDGMQIAFESNRDGGWEFDFWKAPSDIYAMTPDGANLINLTNHPAADGNPAWSPDGNQIAFQSNRDGNDNWEIYVMNADGKNPINLTNHPAEDTQPDWSPDGLRIVFSSNRDGDWEVYVMNADGTNPINLTNHPKWDSQASWEPVPNLSVAPKGKLATLWGKVKRTQ